MKVNIGRYLKNGKRRVDIEIEKHDTYSLDHTLALIILPALLQLKATQNGLPAEFGTVGGEDYHDQYCFDFYTETHKESFEHGVKRWEEVLDKMIWSFEQIAKGDWEDQYRYGKAEIIWEPTDEKIYNPISKKTENTYKMVDKNPSSHYTDYEGMREHEKRIQEGLELFGKYYQNLWD